MMNDLNAPSERLLNFIILHNISKSLGNPKYSPKPEIARYLNPSVFMILSLSLFLSRISSFKVFFLKHRFFSIRNTEIEDKVSRLLFQGRGRKRG